MKAAEQLSEMPPTTDPETAHYSASALQDFSSFPDNLTGEPKTPEQRIKAGNALRLTADTYSDYLKQIEKIPLLKGLAEEVELAKAIEAGVDAELKLTEEEITDYHERAELENIQQRGRAAKEQLVLANLRLVVHIAKGYTNRGLPLVDMVQDGNIGLIKAAEEYDYHRGLKFSTYAGVLIHGAIARQIANEGRIIRLPVHMIDAINVLKRETRELQILGLEPTVELLAEVLDKSPEVIIEMQQLINGEPISLEQPIGESEIVLGDTIESDELPVDRSLDLSMLREGLHRALATLPERTADILRRRSGMHDGKPHSYVQIGKVYGISEKTVRTIANAAWERLSHSSVAGHLRDFLN